MGYPVEHGVETGGCLQAGQWGAHAQMDAPSEAEVAAGVRTV